MIRALDEYEAVGRPFDAQFPGYCAVNYDHKVKRGERVTKVQRADNPLIPVGGVACGKCTKIIPKAARS